MEEHHKVLPSSISLTLPGAEKVQHVEKGKKVTTPVLKIMATASKLMNPSILKRATPSKGGYLFNDVEDHLLALIDYISSLGTSPSLTHLMGEWPGSHWSADASQVLEGFQKALPDNFHPSMIANPTRYVLCSL